MSGASTYCFTPMREEHLDWVSACEVELHTFPWTSGNFLDSMAAGHGSWVMSAGADKLGYAPDPMLQALVAYRGSAAVRRNPPTLAYVTNWNTRMGWRETTAHPDFYAGAETRARAHHELLR